MGTIKSSKSMSYARKPRRVRKSVAWYKKKYSPMQLATNAMNAVKYVKGIINSEVHLHDQNVVIATTSTDYTGSFNSLSLIQQGDTNAERVGMSILAKSLLIKYVCNMNASSVGTNLRLMVVMDKSDSNTAPTTADLLSQVTSTVAPISPLRKFALQRYRVLADKCVLLTGTNDFKHGSIYVPVNKHLKYDGPENTKSTFNQLYLVVVSNEATNSPSLTATSRLSYYDN